MRFLFLALLTIAGILLAVVLMQKGQARIAAETIPASTAPATTATVQTGGGVTGTTGTLPTPAVPPPMERLPANAVAANSSAALPADQQSVAAVQQPAPAPDVAAAAKPPAPKTPEPSAPAFQIVAKPAVVAAGILETTRGRVTLKDITPLDPAMRCGQGASQWPCGQLALTQLRRFLRGRSVNCDIADPAWQGEVTARCTLGKEDVAAWLVENGWVRPAPGSTYEKAGQEAEAGKRGVFSPDPRHP
ncbi:endonuclease YncB(thermonuclease family) [Rhizobium aquaticum]|uniref:Endonuclease YncB(Thermonuclease family) n=1 Tax=Rhizobium aquaticum TaxID=1549636 RepID=A0ABV2J056_9HYPH